MKFQDALRERRGRYLNDHPSVDKEVGEGVRV